MFSEIKTKRLVIYIKGERGGKKRKERERDKKIKRQIERGRESWRKERNTEKERE